MSKENEFDLNLFQGSGSQTYLEADGMAEPPYKILDAVFDEWHGK